MSTHRFSVRSFWSGLAVLLGVLLLTFNWSWVPESWPDFRWQPSGAMAQSPSPTVQDLQKWRKTVEEYRSGVSQQRQQLQQLEEAARDRLGGLRRNVQVTTSQLQANAAKLQQANQMLQKLEAEFAIADQAYQKKQSATVARLRFLQRHRQTNSWVALLQSQTLNEFLDRRRQLQMVYQADQRLLISLKTEADQLKDRKRAVEAQKNQIALLSQALLAQKADYEAQAKQQAQLVGRLTSDRQALEAAEDQLARDSQTLALLIQHRTGGIRRSETGEIIAYGTGRMILPANGPITSSFGWRVHPILGTSRFHAGTDFGAEYGSPIRAADSGTVIFSGWYGGYGNAVIIDHGNGISTLYGHASALYVEEGQAVQRGQAIAAVGSTGLSTGPHLHFEVRRQGEPVDPLAYLR